MCQEFEVNLFEVVTITVYRNMLRSLLSGFSNIIFYALDTSFCVNIGHGLSILPIEANLYLNNS